MATNVRLSKKGSLQIADYIRGGLLAALASVLNILYDLLPKGDLSAINWKTLGISATTVFVGYLIKNGVFESPKVITTVGTNTQAEQVESRINNVV